MEVGILTGGSGRLGTEIVEILPELMFPNSSEFNILNIEQMRSYIKNIKVDYIVHAAAYTDVLKAEDNPEPAIESNLIGTLNVLKLCKENNIRLVYISTDYVFDGKSRDYDIDDAINPLTNYAKTKAAAELIVRTYENSLVIRTSFFGREFPYEAAFVNQYTSKDYVDLQAPRIIKAFSNKRTGIVHVGTTRRSIYEIAKIRKPHVEKMFLTVGHKIPKDTSLKETI
jgi:dTDP-4-dehydrorhamnose reductase